VSYDHRPSCAFLFCLWCHLVLFTMFAALSSM
jgi:hypothetical protein